MMPARPPALRASSSGSGPALVPATLPARPFARQSQAFTTFPTAWVPLTTLPICSLVAYSNVVLTRVCDDVSLGIRNLLVSKVTGS